MIIFYYEIEIYISYIFHQVIYLRIKTIKKDDEVEVDQSNSILMKHKTNISIFDESQQSSVKGVSDRNPINDVNQSHESNFKTVKHQKLKHIVESDSAQEYGAATGKKQTDSRLRLIKK